MPADHAQAVARHIAGDWWRSQDASPDHEPPDSLVDVIARALTDARRAGAWQDIDTAPKDGTPILLYADTFVDADFNPRGSLDGCWQDDEGWKGAVWNAEQDVWDTVVVVPTHWMAQPDPPLRQRAAAEEGANK